MKNERIRNVFSVSVFIDCSEKMRKSKENFVFFRVFFYGNDDGEFSRSDIFLSEIDAVVIQARDGALARADVAGEDLLREDVLDAALNDPP